MNKIAAVAVAVTAAATAAAGSTHPPPPEVLVPACATTASAAVDGLQLSSGAGPFPAPTRVELCWDEDALHIMYQALDDTWLKNEHNTCNSETWQ